MGDSRVFVRFPFRLLPGCDSPLGLFYIRVGHGVFACLRFRTFRV